MKSLDLYITEALIKTHVDPSLIGIKLVDLGLKSGTLWSECNIGAKAPWELGDYYMWGSVKPYASDKNDWENYNYDDIKSYTYDDNLKKEHDVAYVTTKGMLTMPAVNDIKELINGTHIEFCPINRVQCFKFISNADESKFIIMPLGGYIGGNGIVAKDMYGSIWTATAYNSKKSSFLSYYNDRADIREDNKYVARLVRGIQRK